MSSRVVKSRELFLAAALCALACGCGTTKFTDTPRTATEQLLISDAVDRAISEIDLGILSGRAVYLDVKYLTGATDEKYIISSFRQHMLASGLTVKEKPEEADYVLEIRSGAVGTNRHDLLYGSPSTSLPVGGIFPLIPSQIPEIPLVKRTAQQGVCKIAVFAYDRETGSPVWQSGIRQKVSKSKDVWVFGAGPFQRGTIYDGTKFAGEKLFVPLGRGESEIGKRNDQGKVWVAHEILFVDPAALTEKRRPEQGVAQAPAAGKEASPQSLPPVAADAAASRPTGSDQRQR